MDTDGNALANTAVHEASTSVAPSPSPADPSTTVAPIEQAAPPAEAPAGLSSVPASLHAPVNLGTITTGPDEVGKLPPAADDADEPDLVDFFEDFVDEVKGRKEAVATDTFLGKLQKIGPAQGFRIELRDWIYGLMIKHGNLSAGQAIAFGRLCERIDDMEDEQERQGKLLRALSMNYLSMLALALAKMTLESGVDENQKKGVAAEIVNLVASIQTMAQASTADAQAVMDTLQAQAGGDVATTQPAETTQTAGETAKAG